MELSKRKIKKLRKTGDPKAPLPRLGIGHVVYSGFGKHQNLRRKRLERAVRNDIN